MPGFDPHQPRDSEGRWTDTGASAIAIASAASDIGDQADMAIKDANEAMPEIQGVAEKIAAKYNATVTPPNIKSKESIIRKAKSDYNGDVSKVRDTARNTIVAPAGALESIINDLSKLPGTIKVKRQSADTDPLGYSGTIVNYRAKNGVIGEIQVNTPDMIYAKEPEVFAKGILGKEYSRLDMKYNHSGGKGHVLYEEWRVIDLKNPANNDRVSSIEKKSKTYYANFR